MANPKQIARQQAQRFFSKPSDVSTFLRQMKQEAGFKDLRSPAGAEGYAQFMPGTARAVGLKNPHDPTQAYGAAAKLMRQYLDKYHGSWQDALVAYNAGPGAVGGSLPGETRAYLSSILGGSRPSAGGKPQNGAQSVSSAGGGTRQDVELGTKTTFDQAGFEQAQKKALLAGFLTKHGRGNSVLFSSGLLSTAAPNPGDFTTSALTSKIITRGRQSSGSGASSSPSGTSAKPAEVKGTAMFEGHRVAAWIKPELEYARKHGWKGTINSGFRSYADQKRIYDSGVRPAAKPGQSNHEGADFPRGAVDVSDAAELARILRKKGSPLVWAGSKDPVHFSHPHNGSY